MRAAILFAVCAACRIPDEQFPVTDAVPGDAVVSCDLGQPFGAPVPITELNDPSNSELGPRLSHDELVIYFWVRLANSNTGGQLLTASRSTPGGMFGQATPLAIDDTSLKRDPTVTGDNLTLYFASDKGTQGTKIFAATRMTTDGDFANPAQVVELDSGTGDDDIEPYVMPNNQQIYFSSMGSGTVAQLYASRRIGGGAFVKPYQQAFANINGIAVDASNPVVTVDQLTVYFASTRTGGQGGADIWKATRGNTSVGFGKPVNVTEVNTTDYEAPGWISDDGCRLYLARSPLGVHNWKLFVATKPPM